MKIIRLSSARALPFRPRDFFIHQSHRGYVLSKLHKTRIPIQIACCLLQSTGLIPDPPFLLSDVLLKSYRLPALLRTFRTARIFRFSLVVSRMTLWIFFMSSFLICTTLASHNGYSDYESPKLGQNSGIHKGSFSDSRWTASEDERSNYPYAQEGPFARGKVMDLNVWPENDAVSLSRQIFGEKSSGELFAKFNPR
ncbi:uncharacterized protein NPIL_208731 [Nephila pilipes]|uniref:Uncharacterized protein n=1 Tax=Nephila pilipes TaxID=299642 RepID=A0A8X6TCN7_NEPPI|nr:uncharacterized protein NPIL_252341 [Nephila pilipes]GFS97846.1 uncharacterized protein NPIL_208731 [Nephila pilipes]